MSFLIRITNLPQSVNQSSFTDLLDSVVKTNLPFNFSYVVTEFIEKAIDTDKDTDSISSDDELKYLAAIVRLEDYYYCLSLVNILNGYEWLGKILNVEILNNEKDTCPSNAAYKGSQSRYMYLQLPFHPMYPYLPPQYSTPFANPNRANYQIPPLQSPGSSVRTSISSNYPFSDASQRLPYSSRALSLNTIEILDSTKQKSETHSKPETAIDNTKDQSLNQSWDSEGQYIVLKDEDQNEFIKVNPCRLFIGNVPYSSNWVSLRNFFVSKAKEIDSSKKVDILRVEIPMQAGSVRSKSDSFALGNYPTLGDGNHFLRGNIGVTSTSSSIPINPRKSRGFAIVITANRESATNLINMFDNINFEGRSLTVRFDKFPDYNNYTIQQLHAPTTAQRQGSFGVNSAIISNLAFERNLLQHKLYYGNMINPYYDYMHYNNFNADFISHGQPYYEIRNCYRSNYNYSSKNQGRNYDTINTTPHQNENFANEPSIDPKLSIFNVTDPVTDQEKPQTNTDEDDQVHGLVTSFNNIQLSPS